MRLTIAELRLRALSVRRELARLRAAHTPSGGVWYPYDIFGNLKRIWRMLGPCYDLGPLLANGIYDVGTADGDLAFLFESFGVDVAAVDNPGTNCNRMTGIRLLKELRHSKVGVHELDMDRLPDLPAGDRSFTFLMGILYHLKNPLGVLERIRERSSHCLISTRIAMTTPDQQVHLERHPLGYLLDADECNHDTTNYWVFSIQGLHRVVSRAGWHVVTSYRHGVREGSDPVRRDERAFMLLARR